jgi:polyisoprenyl-phosphate glycosyltransferase
MATASEDRVTPDVPLGTSPSSRRVREVSVIVPVFRGETTLDDLLDDLEPLFEVNSSPSGIPFEVKDVVLVWDRGPDRSDEVIRRLAARHDRVQPVWLSRNFGQHAATMAGIAASLGEWVVTLDEDGLHDPRHVGALIDQAFERHAQLVYGVAENRPPHGRLRNAGSRLAKWVYRRFLTDGRTGDFASFRLILGEVARGVVATAGSAVYLDVALGWGVQNVAQVSVPYRSEGRPAKNYSARGLGAHFGRLILSSGARPLRAIAVFGLWVSLGGLIGVGWVALNRLVNGVDVQGWASTFSLILLTSGAILMVLSVIAGYVSFVVAVLQGRPLFIPVTDEEWVFGS